MARSRGARPGNSGLPRPARALVCLAAQLIEGALARFLVVAKAHEPRPVADPIPRDVVELHLHHQLRPEPLPDQLLVRLPAARLAASALAPPVPLPEADQLSPLPCP